MFDSLVQRVAEWGDYKCHEKRHKIINLPNNQFVYIEYTFDKKGISLSYHPNKDEMQSVIFEPGKDPYNPYLTPDGPRQSVLSNKSGAEEKQP